MATFPMLGNYSIVKQNATTFKVNFQYPNNCNFETQTLNNTYYVYVNLNEGETQPSTTYIDGFFHATLINNVVSVKFEQYLSNGTIMRKPNTSVIE